MRSGLWLAVVRGLGLVVAAYLWADLAKTVIATAMPHGTRRASGMSCEYSVDVGPPTRFPLRSLKATPSATSLRVVNSTEDCWAPDPVYGVRRIPEAEYVIHVNAPGWSHLSNVDEVFPQARVIPSVENGVYRGFEFVRVRAGSLYDKLGIEKGDILRRINGYEMNGPDRALEVYQKLRECNRFEVEIERRGEILRKTYRVEQ